MFSGKIRTAATLSVLALGLGACADMSTTLAYRWGPDPTMPAAHIDPVLDNQMIVLGYIECRAGLGMTVPSSDPTCANQPSFKEQWPNPNYQKHFAEVAQWGYNVGRQDCEAYMGVLFQLNRQKGRNDTIIAQLASTSAAIAGVALARPATTLSVLAATFGLVAAVNDAYYNTYLFSSSPGLVSKKVQDLQADYVNKLTAPTSPAEAYAAVQGYYQICLPDQIEGVFTQTIANGQPDTSKPGTTPTQTSGQKKNAQKKGGQQPGPGRSSSNLI
jgi:hypothetical protein